MDSQYSEFFNDAADALYILDASTNRIIDCNLQACLQLGYQREEVLKLKPIDIDISLTEIEIERVHEKAKHNHPVKFETTHKRKDGSSLPVEIHLTRLSSEHSNIIISSVRDITERKRLEEARGHAEEALRRNQEKLKLALNSAQMSAWEWDIIADKRTFDDQTCCLLGLDPVKFNGSASEFYSAVHPEDREMLQADMKRTIEQNEPYEPHYRVVWKDGSIHHIAGRGSLLRDDAGNALKISGILWDITPRKKTEEALKSSETKLRAIFETVGTGILIIDRATQVIIEANQSALQMIGLAKNEVIGRDCNSLVCPAEMGKCPVKDLAKTVYHSECKLVCDGGFTKDILKTVTPIVVSGRNCLVESFVDITSSKKVQEDLAQSEESYRQLTENSIVGICILQDAKIAYINPSAARTFGYMPDEIIGRLGPADLIHPDDIQVVVRRLGERFEGKIEEGNDVYKAVKKNGELIYIEGHSILIKYGGRPAVMITAQDVTDRKRVEGELRKNNEQLEVLFDASRELSLSLDLKEVCRTLLRSVSRVMSFDTMIISSFDPAEKLIRCLYVFDSDLNEIDTSFYPPLELENDGKGPQHVVVRTGKALLLNDFETHFRSAAKYYYVDGKGNVMTELPEDEERSRSAILVPLKSQNQVIGVLQVLSNRLNNFTEDNLNLVESISAHAAASITNALLYSRVQTELAELTRAEANTKESEAKFRSAFMTGMDAFYLATLEDGLIIEINDNFKTVFGYTREEVIGKTSLELGLYANPGDRARMVAEIKDKGYVKDLELQGTKKGGASITISISVSILILNGKQHILGIIRDITDRKLDEVEKQQLRNKAEMSSRLAAVGEMASGVAHEINNPLTSVIGFSELLLEENVSPDIKRQLQIIAAGGLRVKDIVKRMLTFARQNKPMKTDTSINELIDATLDLRSYVLKTANITVTKRLAKDLPPITVDPGQIQQVFLNLIVNAEHSMKKAQGERNLVITTEFSIDKVLISFRDDGIGMSRDVKDKIFNPFFTTKGDEGGTGLGLSLSRSIILEHSGSIEVESEPGQGATFIIILPIIQNDKAGMEKKEPENQAPLNSLKSSRILVVDDEKHIRTLISTILARNGFNVDVTGNYLDVFEFLRTKVYDAILMDIRMPGMSGLAQYESIIAQYPDLAGKIIFITGDTSDLAVRSFFELNKIPHISKPFDKETLLSSVGEILSVNQ